MKGLTEKLDKTFTYDGKAAARRWYKRLARRGMRRLWKLHGEMAPKKYYYAGWFW